MIYIFYLDWQSFQYQANPQIIQKYRLEDTVGLLQNEQAESKPQIWFVPNDGRDFMASDNLIHEMELRIDSRISQLDKQDFFNEQFPAMNDPTS
jgi:hypothetical protein